MQLLKLGEAAVGAPLCGRVQSSPVIIDAVCDLYADETSEESFRVLLFLPGLSGVTVTIGVNTHRLSSTNKAHQEKPTRGSTPLPRARDPQVQH